MVRRAANECHVARVKLIPPEIFRLENRIAMLSRPRLRPPKVFRSVASWLARVLAFAFVVFTTLPSLHAQIGAVDAGFNPPAILNGAVPGTVRAFIVQSTGKIIIAAMVGVQNPTVLGWMSGSQPYMPFLRQLSERTGINLEWLLQGKGDERKEL
jgi:hypothetical protein